MTTVELLRSRRQAILDIARRHGVTSVRLFGSARHGQDRQDSDIDLLVTTGPSISAWFPAGFCLELQSLLGRKVDVVTEAGLHPLLREQVLNEALEL